MPPAPEHHVSWRTYAIALIVLLLLLAAISYAYSYFRSATGGNTAELNAAQQAFNSNDFTGAIASADKVLAADPSNVQALTTKAMTLAQEGSLTFQEQKYGTQAIAVAQQALKIDPQSAEAWRIIGYANEIQQNYAAAHTAYQRSLALDPHNALTLFDDAHAWDLQGDIAKAEAGYKASLAIAPTFDQALLGMGRVLIAQGYEQGALSSFEAAAAHTQNARTKAEALYSAGVIEQSMGEAKQADAQNLMQAATAADPTYAQAWSGLAKSLFADALSTTTPRTDAERTSLVNESFQYLHKAISLNPNQSSAHLEFGLQLLALGHTADALIVFRGLETIIPQDITLSANAKEAMLAGVKAYVAKLSSSS